VIGLNTRTLLRGTDLAVPTITLRRVVDELLAHGGIRRGYLGVGAYPTKDGALIASLEDGSPAAQAGLLVGDIIIELAGDPIDGPDALRLALGDRAGQSVSIAVVRGGARLDVSATIGSKS
jgi:S1-C subfamily serine protease